MENFLQKNVLENHFLVGLAVVAFTVFLWDLRSILIALFIAYILMAALSPAVDFFVSRKMKRGLAVSLIFIALVSGILTLVLPLVPFVIGQTTALIDNFPFYLERTGSFLGLAPESFNLGFLIRSEADLLGKNVLTLTTKAFSGIFSLFTTLIVGFYLLIDRDKLRDSFSGIFGNENKSKVFNTIQEVDFKLGSWVRGQLVLSLCVGMASWIGLTLLSVPFALPLAIIAGIFETLPIIGPIISAVPAVIIAFTISPQLALGVVLLYTGIQLLENNILVPQIMKHAVGLNPVIIILAVTAGSSLLGIVGALLSIPVILVFSVVLKQYRQEK